MQLSDLLPFLAGIVIGALLSWVLLSRTIARHRRGEEKWWSLFHEILGRTHRSGDAVPLGDPQTDSFKAAKEAWNDVKHAGERLDAVLRAMPEGIALIDGRSRVLFCNPGFTGLFRVREREAIDPAVFDQKDGQSEIFRVLTEARHSLKTSSHEIHIATTPPRDLLLTVTPYADDRARDYLILTALDITNRKKADQLRSEFVANVSHELRTPLAAIRGYIETVLEDAEEDPNLAPAYRRFLPIIHQHALRLNALIEDLLILSRIESKAVELNLTPIPVYPAVENAIATLAGEAERKGVALVNSVPPMLPDVRADMQSLERILINIIENAIKYSDENSEVSITGRSQGDEVCLMVEDEGVGIAKEHLTRIFERFYRVDKARSRNAGGTGLGLSIVRHLVRALGGEVWVDSEPGRGSTFFFTIPVAAAAPVASALGN